MAVVVLMQLLRLCIPRDQCNKFMGVPGLCLAIEILGIASFQHRVICGLTLALYRYALMEKRGIKFNHSRIAFNENEIVV